MKMLKIVLPWLGLLTSTKESGQRRGSTILGVFGLENAQNNTPVAGPAHLHEGMRAAAWEYRFGLENSQNSTPCSPPRRKAGSGVGVPFWESWGLKMLKIVLPLLGLLTSTRECGQRRGSTILGVFGLENA